MADSLASLFDSPPGPSRPLPPPPPPRSDYSRTPSPSPRHAEPLFLSPGDTPVKAPARRPISYTPEPEAESEVDRFAELESRYRAIEAEHANENGITTAALGGGVYDPLAPLNGNLGDDDEDGPPTKKRKPIPKIDAERLMGPHGLPALMREANRFKVRGKGHENSDLKALLQVYQIWAHGMFPKGDFMGTMTRVENQLRTRRMENAMKGYREAFHPPPPPAADDGADARVQDGLLSPPPEDQDDDGATGAPAPAREEPLFDDVDLDEMAAMEEIEREAAAGAGGAGAGARRAMSSEPPVLQEEDEWEGLYD